MPMGTALKVVVEGFKNDLGFPQCAGAVDGTHRGVASIGLSGLKPPPFVFALARGVGRANSSANQAVYICY